MAMMKPWMDIVTNAAKRHGTVKWHAISEQERNGLIALEALDELRKHSDAGPAAAFARSILHAMRLDKPFDKV